MHTLYLLKKKPLPQLFFFLIKHFIDLQYNSHNTHKKTKNQTQMYVKYILMIMRS